MVVKKTGIVFTPTGPYTTAWQRTEETAMADNIYDGWVIEERAGEWTAVRFSGKLTTDTEAELKALIDEKERPTLWPQIGQERMKVQGTRVTLCTIRYDKGHSDIVRSAHIMFEHDDMYSMEFKGGLTEREAIAAVTQEIKERAKLKADAERRAERPVPGTIGTAVHRLLLEATFVYDTHGDEFDLEDLKEAVDWVQGFLVDSVIVRADRPREGEPDGHVP